MAIRKKKRKKTNRLYEFSKKVVVAMVILWFIVAAFAMFIIYKDNTLLEPLLNFIGMPVAGTIILYMAKTAFENKEKIRCGNLGGGQNDSPPQPPNIGDE